MRALLAAVVTLAAAGCFDRAGVEATPGDDAGGPPPGGSCVVAADCVGAGASCCGCPEYAVTADSDWAQACDAIDCPPPQAGTCSGLVPVCDDGQCALGCAPVSCDQTCDIGFAVDAAGCLTCQCAAGPLQMECAVDTDCAQVPADCCGCANGGADTAVPVDQVDAHRASLGCPPDPVCPGVDVCTPGVAAHCNLSGLCELGTGDPGTLPAGACGTPDLPPCPAGQTCVLNSDGGATEQGVGVCL